MTHQKHPFLNGMVLGVLVGGLLCVEAGMRPMQNKILATQAQLAHASEQLDYVGTLARTCQARFEKSTVASVFIVDSPQATAANPQAAGVQLFHGMLEIGPGAAFGSAHPSPAVAPPHYRVEQWFIPADVEPTFLGPDVSLAFVGHWDPVTHQLVGGVHHPQLAKAAE